MEYRKRFYPGAAYVDISGIDIYGVDFKTADQKYWDYYRAMSQVSPGKMLACGEGDAIPNPELMQKGELPKWLYALPWWGTPSPQRPADWAVKTMRHDFIVTLDELPAFGDGNIAPHVGILQPLDDGSAWFPDGPVKVNAYAVDRDGKVQRVDFYADDKLIGTVQAAPCDFTWDNAPPGCYDQTWEATDRVRFKATDARYVRLRATKRAGNQTWSGYKLTALEVPIARERAKQKP